MTCPNQISSESDAADFFRYLYLEASVMFHPDDSFEGYVNIKTGEPSFTPEQCKKFNTLMDQAFAVCCPYEVGMRVAREEGIFPPEESDED